MLIDAESKEMNPSLTCANQRAFQYAIVAALLCATTSVAGAQWTVVNLHPAGTLLSTGYGASGGQQVGDAQVGPTFGTARASLWSGTAASWVNLHPAGTDLSLAYGVDSGQQE